MISWLVLKLELNYRVIICILKDFSFFQRIFLKITFLHHEIFELSYFFLIFLKIYNF
jgi:hypothetical protein